MLSMKNYDTVDYTHTDVRSQIMSIFYNNRSAELLLRLSFDIRKYSTTNFSFLMADLSRFLYGLNKNFSIYNEPKAFEDLDIMCFFEPWLADFLEKVLEKKDEADRFFDHA